MTPTNNAAAADADLRRIAELARGNRLAEARAATDAAILAYGQTDALLAVAAMLAARAGDPATVARHLEILVARRPDDHASRRNLAQALVALGRFDAVVDLLAPLAGDPAVDRLLAYAAQQGGDLGRAAALYRTLVARSPADADGWANLGNVLAAQGDLDAAIQAYEKAITRRRGDVRFYLNLAGVLERADRNVARARVMRDAAAIEPDDAEVQLALGLAEAALEDFAAAESALRRAIAVAPDARAAWLELGIVLENANRLDDLDALIAAGRAHIGPEIALLEAWSAFRHKRFDEAARHAAALPDTLSALRRHHLQGEIADRMGDAAAAFAHFTAMNAASLAAAPVTPPSPSYRATVAATHATLGALPPARVPATDGVPAPVFVVGFPRSGTTLLDTILGRLPGTIVLEEQPLIAEIERAIGGADKALALAADEVADHRLHYRDQLVAAHPDAAGKRIVDKHPLHMARMPLLHALFPDARILFVERHPFDVVLSCYVSNFRLNHAMRSFIDLREAALTYDAVLSAWTAARGALDLAVHTVRYERLVANTEGEVRAALDFIGAAYDPALIDTVAAAKDRGRIRTASYAQVAEPIYRRSVARWERYREQLAPVREILAPWVERFGYTA